MLFIKIMDIGSYVAAAGTFLWGCVTTDMPLMATALVILAVGQLVVQALKSGLGYDSSLKDELFDFPWWYGHWWW